MQNKQSFIQKFILIIKLCFDHQWKYARLHFNKIIIFMLLLPRQNSWLDFLWLFPTTDIILATSQTMLVVHLSCKPGWWSSIQDSVYTVYQHNSLSIKIQANCWLWKVNRFPKAPAKHQKLCYVAQNHDNSTKIWCQRMSLYSNTPVFVITC